MSSPLQIVVIGAAGRMGQEALRALVPAHGFAVTGAVIRAGSLPTVPTFGSASAALEAVPCDRVLDLSLASAARENAAAALSARKPYVSGVTGIADEDLEAIRIGAEEANTPALIVPNFAIGAVLMMRFAELAARWLPDVEVIERHHERKLDAPSGTALLTAQRIARGRSAAPTVPPTEKLKVGGVRGGEVEGVRVHSIRLPGSLAHQEILFGAPGETLTIRHDAADRSVYMPGVRLALHRVTELSGLTVGLDALLGIDR
jgi:4-hydroxy-tetrahydrodipicolinate reductase